MPIVYGDTSVLTRLVWSGAMFRSGNATTNLGWNLDVLAANFSATALANNLAVAWGASIRSQMDNGITLVEVQWETKTQSGSVNVNQACTRTSEAPPSSVTALLSYYALGKGRRNRGRSYWPGLISENEVSEGGDILTTRTTTIDGAFDTFFADVNASLDVEGHAIAQSQTDESITPPIVPWPLVNGRVVQTIVASQRRRVRP